jgi:ADP-heptose:LPS heptosyltransferase
VGHKRRILVVPKGSNKLKEWPDMNCLIKKLYEHGLGVIALNGAKEKYKHTFRRAAALVAVSDLVISPDSGISNLAGALNIPAITIFSNRNGENFKKMFKSMIPIQGDCPHREKNYCDFFCPCFGSGPHRAKENIRIPDCLKKLKMKKIYDVVEKVLAR